MAKDGELQSRVTRNGRRHTYYLRTPTIQAQTQARIAEAEMERLRRVAAAKALAVNDSVSDGTRTGKITRIDLKVGTVFVRFANARNPLPFAATSVERVEKK
jgi:hypothetical protein